MAYPETIRNLCSMVLFIFALLFCSIWISGGVEAATFCDIENVPPGEIVTQIAGPGDSDASSTCKDDQKTTFKTTSLSSSEALIVCDKQMQDQFAGVPPGWVMTAHYDEHNNCDYVGSNYNTTEYAANRIEKISAFVESSAYKNICTLGNNIGFNQNDLSAVSWIVSPEIPSGSYCGDVYQKRRIKRAASGESMCATYGEVPYGFTVSRIVQSDTSCTSALFSSARRYELGVIPSTGTQSTCVLPKNYHEYAYTLRTSQTSTCANGPQYTIGRAFEGGYSCSVPVGWGASAKVSETNTLLNCSSNFVYRLTALRSGLTTCYLENDQAPSGYVVSNFVPNACSGSAGYTIRTPQDGVYMCSAYSSIPTGFWYGTASQQNNCTSGYVLKTLPSTGSLSTCGEPPSAPPDGYVYTSISEFSSCPIGKKRYTIGAAADPQQICYVYSQSGPIPQGYMISSDRAGANCAAGVPYTIRVVYDGMQACSPENMPAGYGIGSVTNSTNTNCSDYYITIRQMTGEGPYTICSTNDVPAGYVITSVDNNSTACSGKGFEIRKPVLSGDGATYSRQVCVDQPISTAGIPQGMVIREIVTNNTSCYGVGQSGVAYEIGFPNSSGQTVACQGFGNPQYELPAGFNVVSTSTFSVCNGGSGWLLEPEFSGAIPADFVLPEPDVSTTDVATPSYDCGGTGTNIVIASASKNTITCP